MATVLETTRLLLREMIPADLDFVATMLGDPDVARYYERRFTRRDAEAWLDRQLERYRRDGHGLWLVTDRQDGTPVGQVGLAIQEVEGEQHAEVGWLLHRPFWGRGYATEAGAATRDAAFSRWGYPGVISLIRPENIPSQKSGGTDRDDGRTPRGVPRVRAHGLSVIDPPPYPSPRRGRETLRQTTGPESSRGPRLPPRAASGAGFTPAQRAGFQRGAAQHPFARAKPPHPIPPHEGEGNAEVDVSPWSLCSLWLP